MPPAENIDGESGVYKTKTAPTDSPRKMELRNL